MKKPSAFTAEDKKFLWYHLSLPPRAASWGPNSPASCIGLFPSVPTCGSARPLRKEFHIRIITASHRPAALWEDLWMCTDFHHCVVYVCSFVFSNSIALPLSQVNKNTQIFRQKYKCFSWEYLWGRRNGVECSSAADGC